ncbi:MAG: hypothetical protein V2J19_04085 [Wenzhouxiangella sp.]|nr:hypothetical protein [Wenzhouxiangella sp.]
MIKQTMNGNEFAGLCGVSADTVSRWCQKGMPHQGGGRSGVSLEIDVRLALPWLASQKSTSSTEQLRHEQAQKAALENEETRRALVKSEHVATIVDQMQKALAKRLKVPKWLVDKLAASGDPALSRALLQQHIRDVRNRYAADVAAMGTQSHKAKAEGK